MKNAWYYSFHRTLREKKFNIRSYKSCCSIILISLNVDIVIKRIEQKKNHENNFIYNNPMNDWNSECRVSRLCASCSQHLINRSNFVHRMRSINCFQKQKNITFDYNVPIIPSDVLNSETRWPTPSLNCFL